MQTVISFYDSDVKITSMQLIILEANYVSRIPGPSTCIALVKMPMRFVGLMQSRPQLTGLFPAPVAAINNVVLINNAEELVP